MPAAEQTEKKSALDLVREAEERERKERMAEYKAMYPDLVLSDDAEQAEEGSSEAASSSSATTTTTTTMVSFSATIPAASASTVKMSIVSTAEGPSRGVGGRLSGEEQRMGARQGILSSIVRTHEKRQEEQERIKQDALERQQRLARLHSSAPPPSSDSVETLDEAKARIGHLEVELAKYRGENTDLLSLPQLNELEGSLRTTLQRVEQRRRKIEASRRDNFRSCVICRDALRCVVFQCGHLVSCSDCSGPLKHCPICREPILSRIAVHGSLFDDSQDPASL